MNRFRRAVMWAALLLIILLTALSIYGAFIGAERAERFFNSIALGVYWLVLAVLLAVGIIVFRRLIRMPGLLLIHLGCIIVLAGGIWGSKAGYGLREKLFGISKIREGQMVIHEGTRENQVMIGSARETAELPFQVGLKDFRMEYYKPGQLLVQSRQGKRWSIPAEIGNEYPLDEQHGTVKILRSFENFKIKKEDGKNVYYDDPQPGSNPALEVQINPPDGDAKTRYVFELFPGHAHAEDKLSLRYQRVISDYVSELQVIKDDKVVAEKDIEVNHPLYYGGYHFYQHSYDDKAGRYTVLMVVSDTGLNLVYAGYLMLCIGVLWHLWLRHLLKAIKPKDTGAADSGGAAVPGPSIEPDPPIVNDTVSLAPGGI